MTHDELMAIAAEMSEIVERQAGVIEKLTTLLRQYVTMEELEDVKDGL